MPALWLILPMAPTPRVSAGCVYQSLPGTGEAQPADDLTIRITAELLQWPGPDINLLTNGGLETDEGWSFVGDASLFEARQEDSAEGDHHLVIRARRGSWWDAHKIGVASPPLETPEGWLLFYHGVKETVSGCIYRVGLAMTGSSA